eukprot:scaffold18947_cov101-Isochrysis_galbana.AAC.4
MLLPMACRFYADRCSLGHFTSTSTVSAAAVKFRPVMPCELFLQALRHDTALPADQTTSQGHRASTKRAQHVRAPPMLDYPPPPRYSTGSVSRPVHSHAHAHALPPQYRLRRPSRGRRVEGHAPCPSRPLLYGCNPLRQCQGQGCFTRSRIGAACSTSGTASRSRRLPR